MAEDPAPAATEGVAPRPAGRPPAGPPPGERTPVKPAAQALAAAVEAAFAGIPCDRRFNFGDLEISVSPDHLLAACRYCREAPDLAFDGLMSISGLDHESSIEVVYHLYSYRHHHQLTLRTTLAGYEAPQVASVSAVWKSATWHEREAAEMFGITFEGHPDPRPLLLDDDVTEPPLRRRHPLVPLYHDRPGLVMPPGPAAGDAP